MKTLLTTALLTLASPTIALAQEPTTFDVGAPVGIAFIVAAFILSRSKSNSPKPS
jgi:hypothetical protein